VFTWGRVVSRRRWLVLVTVLVLVLLGGVWGSGVFDRLSQGGYEDPGSQSARATKAVERALGRQDGDVVVSYTAPAGLGVDDPVFTGKIIQRLRSLPRDAVSRVTSYWTAHQGIGTAAQFADAAKHRVLAVITLAGADSSTQLSNYNKIKDVLAIDGVPTQVGGVAAMTTEINKGSQADLARAETVSLPITLMLLVVVFGGLVAASLPVLVGGLAILGSLGVLRALTSFVAVNSFAVNVATLLGLGLAIDYGLFVVSRFREELAAGRDTRQAVARTIGTAGRTVAFSATMLVIALSGLLLFPQGFLHSVGYGGMAAVAIAAIVSLTLLPAVLGLLGQRVDALPLPWRRRRTTETGRGWQRLARGVMRRPRLVAVPLLAGLLLVGAPFLHVRFGEVGEKVLPAANPTRQAVEMLNRDFPALGANAIQVVLHGTAGAAPDQAVVARFTAEVHAVRGVTQVQPAGAGADVVVLRAGLTGDALSDQAKQVVKDVRALPAPSGAEVLVGGATAAVTDSLEAISAKLPWMMALVIGATLVLMFLAFGSLVLPIKAVLMSALTTFGALVWVFQDGHGAGLLDVSAGPLVSSVVVLMTALVFGLSTDYEVFLLSRMVEARNAGASTEEAVSAGLTSTGRVISAAALLLIVVTGAFAFSEVAIMRFIGVGMILALALDATVVRMLLVPAVLRLLGRASWWAPGSLRRLQRRVGVHEGPAPTEREPGLVG
jgi:RND superfamily putative drug exporter